MIMFYDYDGQVKHLDEKEYYGIIVSTKEIMSQLKRGDLLYNLIDCCYWETAEYKNVRNPVPAGTIMLYLGPAILYQGMEMWVHESHNWLIGEFGRTIDLRQNVFAVLWTHQQIQDYLQKTKNGLSLFRFAPELSSFAASKEQTK